MLRHKGIALIGVGLVALISSVAVATTCGWMVPPKTSYIGFQTVTGCTLGGQNVFLDASAQGRSASGGLPKRLCANLIVGASATAQGYASSSGNPIAACFISDGSAGNGEICTLGVNDCNGALAHDFIASN